MDAGILLKAGAELWVELSTFRELRMRWNCIGQAAATFVLDSYNGLEWFRDSLPVLWLVPLGFLFHSVGLTLLPSQDPLS